MAVLAVLGPQCSLVGFLVGSDTDVYRKKSLGENVMLLREGVLPKSPAGPGWDCCTVARLLRYHSPSTLCTVPVFSFPTLPLGCMVVAFVCFSFLLFLFSS